MLEPKQSFEYENFDVFEQNCQEILIQFSRDISNELELETLDKTRELARQKVAELFALYISRLPISTRKQSITDARLLKLVKDIKSNINLIYENRIHQIELAIAENSRKFIRADTIRRANIVTTQRQKEADGENSKRNIRVALLKEHPELRIRIDETRLREIIPYESFLASQFSSAANDVAIAGSDIDGGLVIMSQPVDQETELKFVEELRSQGFKVYHESEVRTLQLEVEQMDHDTRFKDEKERINFFDASKRLFDATSETIHFRTRADLEEESMTHQGSLTQDMEIYFSGIEIPSK